MSTDQLEDLKKVLLTSMNEHHAKTNENIEKLRETFKGDIDSIRSDLSTHNERLCQVENDIKSIDCATKLQELTLEIEQLKQDKLRNNLRITGLPENAYNDPDEAVLRIADILNLDIIPSDYTAYVDRWKSSIILCFSSYPMKRCFMDAMRSKQSLFVEEIYEGVKSNARIYTNDQLSVYFANIFQRAWQAKKEGLLHSVSSLGGRIRVQKAPTSKPTVIMTLEAIEKVISSNEPMPPVSQQVTDNQQNQESHQSHAETTHDLNSPQSMDSTAARDIRTKPFRHNRQSDYRSRLATSLPQRQPQQRNNQNKNWEHPQHFPKRNNRHVSSLDNRSQQPFNKRGRFNNTNNTNTSQNQNPTEFDNRRRQYRAQLRSFTR